MSDKRAEILKAALQELCEDPAPGRQWDWMILILEMEIFRAETGWGLARTWELVKRGDYEVARDHFSKVRQMVSEGRPGWKDGEF